MKYEKRLRRVGQKVLCSFLNSWNQQKKLYSHIHDSKGYSSLNSNVRASYYMTKHLCISFPHTTRRQVTFSHTWLRASSLQNFLKYEEAKKLVNRVCYSFIKSWRWSITFSQFCEVERCKPCTFLSRLWIFLARFLGPFYKELSKYRATTVLNHNYKSYKIIITCIFTFVSLRYKQEIRK